MVVTATTVDAYVQANGWGKVTFIKCHAERHDMEVLGGARGYLKRGVIGVFQFEYNHRWVAARRYLKDAFDLPADFRMSLGKVVPRGVEFYDSWHPELVLCSHDWVVRLPRVQWWNEGSA